MEYYGTLSLKPCMEICRISIQGKVITKENSECVESEVGKAKNWPNVGV